MPGLRFTKEDTLARNQLPTTWYKFNIKAYKQDTAKDGESINHVVDFVVADGAQQGTPVRHWFSEKAMGRIVDFFKVFTGGKVDVGKEYNFEDVVGKQILGYAGWDVKMNFNKIEDFKPVDKTAAA